LNDIVERIRKLEKTAPRAVSATLQSKGLIDFEEYGPPHFFSAKSVLISFARAPKSFIDFGSTVFPTKVWGIACIGAIDSTT